jgi:indolepyruvate ferredoxin oxidoreductase beta subunit
VNQHLDGPWPSNGSAGFVSVLIPAVGGQGGGVLSEWIVEAAIADGYVAHGTSIPGVAQRTGSTTYYAEVFPSRDDAPAPTVSLYPVPGALDVLLAPELLEVGRMIELGFPSPARTTVIASTHRLYSIHEKIAIGDALYPTERLLDAARAFSRELHAFDALSLAREHGTEVNAILLGALAGSGAMPMRHDAYRAAIRGKGVQVDANLRGFELGLTLASNGAMAPTGARNGAVAAASPPDDPRVAALPPAVRTIVRQALPRLVDYQDERYVDRYLELLRPFVAGNAEVAAHVARYLALWMTYEDAIRVADLKTRAERFARIRNEAKTPGAVVDVVDYLKPDLDEIYGILPYALVAPFARWAERRWPHGRPAIAQHVRTTTVLGFLRVWLLARLRRLRPISYRARQERARMTQWLEAVRQCAAWDAGLACEVAHAGQLVKGYGDVRRRMCAHLDRLLALVLGAAAAASRAGGDFSDAARLAREYRVWVLSGPEGEAKAEQLTV